MTVPVSCSVCGTDPRGDEECLRCSILWLISPELEEWSACGSTPEDFARAWSTFVERTRVDLTSRIPCSGCGFGTKELHAGVPLCSGCRAEIPKLKLDFCEGALSCSGCAIHEP